MKDQFQLEHQDSISRESTAIRPGCIMVTMRDAANPLALKWTLARTNTDERDVVVISVRMMGVGGPEYLSAEQKASARRCRSSSFPPETSSPLSCKAPTRSKSIP
jgi:hypothetical protein